MPSIHTLLYCLLTAATILDLGCEGVRIYRLVIVSYAQLRTDIVQSSKTSHSYNEQLIVNYFSEEVLIY